MNTHPVTVDELVEVMENERVLDLTEEDLQEVIHNTGIGSIARHCVPERHRRDGFMKALKKLRGSVNVTYAEVGHI